MGSMAVEDTPEMIKYVLSEENLERIWEEFKVLISIGLELPSPSERVTMGSVTRVVLYEEAIMAGLRLPLLAVITELLKWYQVYPTQLVPNA